MSVAAGIEDEILGTIRIRVCGPPVEEAINATTGAGTAKGISFFLGTSKVAVL